MEIVSAAGQELLDLTAALMSLERRPLEQVQARRAVVEQQIAAQRSLASRLSSLRRISGDFSATGSLSPLRRFQVSGDGTGPVRASAGATATAGIHSIEVLALAARHSLASASRPAEGSTLAEAASPEGKFRFAVTVAGATTEVAVDVDPQADDAAVLRAVRDAIDRSGAPITASIVRVSGTEQKLLVQAESSGTAAQIEAIEDLEGSLFARLELGTGRDGSGELTGTVQKAADARLVIDGLEIVSSSNRIENAVSGLNLELAGLSSGPVAVEVGRDPGAVVTELQKLVTAYNETLDEVRNLTRPSDENGSGRGVLADSASFRGLRTSLRGLLTGPVELEAGPRTLASLGITTDREGRLSLNESALRRALQAEPETVENVIGGENGVAARLAGLLEGYSKVGGIVDRQLEAAETRRALFDSRIASLNENLAARERSLFQQLAELQSAIGLLSSQQSYLARFFASGSNG